jgi:hypothetical protein
MMKSKVMHRNSGSRISRGTTVRMSDGWRGKVEENCGSFIACIADGARPCIHWTGDYRLVSVSSVTIEGSKAIVRWKSRPTASRLKVDRDEQLRRVVADHNRARREREWESALD